MITTFYAALLAFLYIGLTVYVIQGRYKHKIAFGDEGNMDLNRRVRMHGNFAENASFGLLLLFLVDLSNAHGWIVHILGLMLVAGRVVHAYGLHKSVFKGRAGGMVLTLAMMAMSSLYLLFKFIF